jgi:DNA topoisomerase-3
LVTKKEANGVRIGKAILQRELNPEQFSKLLTAGKTDLLRGFVSNRTKRAFDARLTFDPVEGKIGFEFEPRPEKKYPPKPPKADKGMVGEDATPFKAAKKATKKVAKKAGKKTARKTAKKSLPDS